VSKQINDSQYWREFEKNELTHSAAHYLMAIDSLREELGYARVTDVADKLNVSRGAASMSIAHLKKRGWVKEDPNRFLLLAEEGAQMANLVEHNFRVLTRFFRDVLGAPKDIAFADACKMEHLLSPEVASRMMQLMHYLQGQAKDTKTMRGIIAEQPESCEDMESCPLCQYIGTEQIQEESA
jgi:DtxR family transcriptional regulator, Mn-dependent transcriptional regulator